MEADLAMMFRLGWSEYLANSVNDFRELFVVGADARVQFSQFFHQFLLSHDHLAESGKDPNDGDAHLHGPGTVQDRRCH